MNEPHTWRWWDAVSTVVVTGAAVAMLMLYVTDRSKAPERTDRYVEEWQSWQGGVWLGSRDADLVIDVFMDFTCPHCRRLAPVLDSILDRYPRDVAMRFFHYPLREEGPSITGAKAAECADRQGKFISMYTTGALLASPISSGRGWEGVTIRMTTRGP